MEKRLLTQILIIGLLSAPVNAATFFIIEFGNGAKNAAYWNNAFQGLASSLRRGSTYYLADNKWDIGAYDSFSVTNSGCSEECASGDRQCFGNGYRVCGNYDSDICNEWSNVTECPADQACSNGVCSTAACTPDWNCTSWSPCINRVQTRVCTDLNGCGTITGKPAVSLACGTEGNLLSNGDFESGFTAGIGDGWFKAADWKSKHILLHDFGYAGSCQKISLSESGDWGIYIYQKPELRQGQYYFLSFWYKSTGGILKAEVTDAQSQSVVLSQDLPVTDGLWKSMNITFRYTNDSADQVRFLTKNAGTYWIDNIVLSRICAGGDNDCDGCIRQDELMQYIIKWKSGQATLANLMESIRLWKIGC